MEIKQDPLVIKFLETKKEKSRHTRRAYYQALKKFSYMMKKPIEKIVEESLKKQMSYSRKQEIINEEGEKEEIWVHIEPDVEKSDLATYFKDFYTYEREKGLKKSSVREHINHIRSFLKYNKVKLPEPLDIKIITNPKKLLTFRKIGRALDLVTNSRDKAIIAFMASSGLRSKDVRYLTIRDFLKATGIKSIKKLLINQVTIIPFYEFKPSKTDTRGFHCKTCNSPRATDLIIEYLGERHQQKPVKQDDPLFVTFAKKVAIARPTFTKIFSELNEKLYDDDLHYFKKQRELNKLDENEGLTEEEYEDEINDISKFHAHGLRAYFINTVSEECDNIKVGLAMEGHKSVVATDKHYVNLKREAVIRHYTPIIPSLSFDDTQVRVVTDKTVEELDEVKGELAETNKKLAEAEKAHAESEKQHQRELELLEEQMTERILAKVMEKTREKL